ncbi:RNA-directed DNA polymerase, eukaryota, partial [Tanacetum coccineum]
LGRGGDVIGRLAWLNIEGLPPLGRNVGAIKSILNEYGHVLEIERLDFESKFLHPIKSLVLINDMNDIRHTLYVSLNGKSDPIRVFKERFDVSNLVPSSSSSVDGSSFEEEYVGHTMDIDNDDGDDFSSKFPEGDGDFERSRSAHFPCKTFDGSRHVGFQDINHYKDTKVPSLSSNGSKSDNIGSHPNHKYLPASSGLPYPPPLDSHMGPDTQVENSFKPTAILDKTGHGPVMETLINNIPSNPLQDLNESFGHQSDIKDNSKEKELDDLINSFQKLSDGDGVGEQHKEGKKSKPKNRKSNSVGASGGILTMWDSRVIAMEHSISERNFLGVIGSPDERSGCLFDSGEAGIVNDFIARTGFFDFPLCGRRFTRFEKDGKKASKLDRFMVSNSFFNMDASVKVLCRSHSDHCLILLKVGRENFRPKPFKIFNKWFSENGFNDLVTSSWASSPPNVRPHIYLKNKLKCLRLDIKDWTSKRLVSDVSLCGVYL